MHQTVAIAAVQPSGDHNQKRNRLATAKAPIYGKPSRCTGASCERMEASTDMTTLPQPRVRWAARGLLLRAAELPRTVEARDWARRGHHRRARASRVRLPPHADDSTCWRRDHALPK